MSLKFDIRGMEGVQAALNKKVDAITKGIDREMTAAALETNAKQAAYTPVDTGRLRSSNGFDVSKPLDKKLFNRIQYAPYIEFGTGGLVTIPVGLEDIALQFKGAGIRQVNMRAQPFFFRAWFEERTKLIQRIKKLIAE
jgi:hypothetical protein